MSITRDKKNFISHLSGGFEVTRTPYSDEIYLHQEEGIEVYIKNNMLEAPVDRHCSPGFSEDKFRQAMETIDDQTLRDLLNYLDERDITMSRVYSESCMVPEDFPQDLAHIAETVVSKLNPKGNELEFSFAHFLESTF